MLYYDSETETFWEQMTGMGAVGPLTGKRLRWIPSEVTTWKDWLERHPETTVLKPPFPMRAYERTNGHYRRYRASGRRWFGLGPVEVDPRYKEMTRCTIVLGADGKGRCYPHPALPEGTTRDGDRTITRKGISVRITDKEGNELPTVVGYWFAWCAFYPDGTVYEGEPKTKTATPTTEKTEKKKAG